MTKILSKSSRKFQNNWIYTTLRIYWSVLFFIFYSENNSKIPTLDLGTVTLFLFLRHFFFGLSKRKYNPSSCKKKFFNRMIQFSWKSLAYFFLNAIISCHPRDHESNNFFRSYFNTFNLLHKPKIDIEEVNLENHLFWMDFKVNTVVISIICPIKPPK